MALPRDQRDQQPWSTDEKNYLLAEIIKANSTAPGVLFNVIIANNIPVNWDDLPLPPGRSLAACRNAFGEIARSQGQYSVPAQYGPPQPSYDQKRPFQYDPVYTGPQSTMGREIRPKPSSASSSIQYNQPTPTEPPVKRKRGRPTKASLAERAQAEAQRRGGPGGPSAVPMATPVVQASPPVMTPTITPTIPRPELTLEVKPAPPPPTTRMPISAVLTPTAPKSASHSGSSSGRRKRRSTRSDLDDPQPAEPEYESPYARVSGGEREGVVLGTAAYHSREETTPSHTPRTTHEPPDSGAPSGT
ncbi:Hypothetical protein R9X50_00691800 [Acrodontium crateriforme]|uniref:Uncharacterized protein n=1 Tax=Acrodontium crateriforme TaxID=150365 RepID=A0AAQ3RAC8_9PEZI|nr:Hypothetical protein R9X50_00691800 [Acrodontium crateriforme]